MYGPHVAPHISCLAERLLADLAFVVLLLTVGRLVFPQRREMRESPLASRALVVLWIGVALHMRPQRLFVVEHARTVRTLELLGATLLVFFADVEHKGHLRGKLLGTNRTALKIEDNLFTFHNLN